MFISVATTLTAEELEGIGQGEGLWCWTKGFFALLETLYGGKQKLQGIHSS